MSYQEKRSIVYLIGNLLIIGAYYVYVFRMEQGQQMRSLDDLSPWGVMVLLIIPVQIVVNIVTHILFAIYNKVATDEEEPSVTDERDKLIELRSVRNAYYAFFLGFFLSMGALSLGISWFTLLNLLVFSLFAAQVSWSISQFFYYRRGY